PFHQQASGMPWWLILEARPVTGGVVGGGSAAGDDERMRPGGVLSVVPNPVAGGARIVFRAMAGASGGGVPPAPAAGAREGRLAIFDIRGRLIRAWPGVPLVSAGTNELRTEVSWDATDPDGRALPSGIYIARFRWANGSATRRIMVAR